MSSVVRRFAPLALLLLGLAACSRPVGDFGRYESDPLRDEVAATVRAARVATEPVSAFNLSDQEVEMRDRIWRYLVAPEAYDWFGDFVVELQRLGFTVKPKPLPKDRYYLWLHGTAFASSRVRYSRISDDVEADIGTMPGVFAAICAVEELDRQRGIAANGIDGLEEKMKRDAAARQIENRAAIGWFAAAVKLRYDSYSYALDHLLVETPHEEAVGTDALLSQLAGYVDAARGGDYCSPDGVPVVTVSGATVASRYTRPVTGTGAGS